MVVVFVVIVVLIVLVLVLAFVVLVIVLIVTVDVVVDVVFVAAIIVGIRKLTLKYGQNWVSNNMNIVVLHFDNFVFVVDVDFVVVVYPKA